MHRVALSRGMGTVEKMAMASPMHRGFQPCIYNFNDASSFSARHLAMAWAPLRKWSWHHQCIEVSNRASINFNDASRFSARHLAVAWASLRKWPRHHQCIEVFQPPTISMMHRVFQHVT
jgi:hypothetical protein